MAGHGLRRQRGGVAQRHGDPEHAAFTSWERRRKSWPSRPAQAFDDGQAQTGAAVVGVAFVQAAEFLEHFLLQALGNAGPLVVHLDAQLLADAAAASHDAALARVADGVGGKVLQDAAQQPRASSLCTT